jgi:hypothetical protein
LRVSQKSRNRRRHPLQLFDVVSADGELLDVLRDHHLLSVSQKRLNRRWHAPYHIEFTLADGQLHDFLPFHHLLTFVASGDKIPC